MKSKNIVVETYGPDFSQLSAEDFKVAFEIYETAGAAILDGFDQCEVATVAFQAWRDAGFEIVDLDGVEEILTCS
jgi:hypothetical protein